MMSGSAPNQGKRLGNISMRNWRKLHPPIFILSRLQLPQHAPICRATYSKHYIFDELQRLEAGLNIFHLLPQPPTTAGMTIWAALIYLAKGDTIWVSHRDSVTKTTCSPSKVFTYFNAGYTLHPLQSPG